MYDTGYTQWYKFDTQLSYYGKDTVYGKYDLYNYYYNGVNVRYVMYAGTEQQWVSDNYSTRWYYQDPVYTYYYYKDEEKEATDSCPSGDNISNVVEWVQYRSK